MTGSSFNVTFICTGNRFRSPLAAALLSVQTDGLPVQSSSLGILDLDSAKALPEAVQLAKSFGIDLSGHRGRCLARAELDPFDLIVAFEWIHVQAAIVDGQARVERTFTLPELVGLLEDLPAFEAPRDPAERARARVEAAHALRPAGFRRLRPPEIPDPLGKPMSAQRRIADELQDLVTRLSRMLFS